MSGTTLNPVVMVRDRTKGAGAAREQAAELIRSHAKKIAVRAEAAAGLGAGMADDHPFLLAMEVAAQVTATDPPPVAVT